MASQKVKVIEKRKLHVIREMAFLKCSEEVSLEYLLLSSISELVYNGTMVKFTAMQFGMLTKS